MNNFYRCNLQYYLFFITSDFLSLLTFLDITHQPCGWIYKITTIYNITKHLTHKITSILINLNLHFIISLCYILFAHKAGI